MNEKVQVEKIWIPVDEGGEAYSWEKQKKLKLVAVIVNGIPIFLEKDFVMELSHINKIEAEEILKQHGKK